MTPLVPKKKELTIIEVIILNIQFSCIDHRVKILDFTMKDNPDKIFCK